MAHQSESLGELAAALARAQKSGLSAAKDAQGQIGQQKRFYADLWSSWGACRNALADNGLAVVQGGRVGADGRPVLATTLVHSSGQWIEGEFPLIFGQEKALSDMQCLGKAITYARRYGLQGIVGIVCEDDDGAGAGKVPTSESQRPPATDSSQSPRPSGLSAAQVDELRRLCRLKGVSEQQLCRRYGLKELFAMTLRSFGECMQGFSKMPDVAQAAEPPWPRGDGGHDDGGEIRV